MFAADRIRAALYISAIRSPLLIRPYRRLSRGLSEGWPQQDTDAMIEGFPRSANTYAVVALKDRNQGLSVASHTHSPLALRRGVELGLPAVFLTREPVACLASWRIREPTLSLFAAIKLYRDLYSTALELVEGLSIQTFEAVTRDPSVITSGLNRYWGIEFQPPDVTPEGLERMQLAVQLSELKFGGKRFTDRVALPSERRTKSARAVAAEVERTNRQHVVELRSLYETLNTAGANRS